MALTALLIGSVVVGSVGYLAWAASRRHWNAEGQDDVRREGLGREDGTGERPAPGAGPGENADRTPGPGEEHGSDAGRGHPSPEGDGT